MHRHTTNSISTASAVSWALKKLISRREGPGAKWGLKYQLPLMGERGKKLMDATFPQILCFLFHFSSIWFLLESDNSIQWGKNNSDWTNMRCRSGKNAKSKMCRCKCVRSHNLHGQKKLYLSGGKIQGLFFFYCGLGLFTNSITWGSWHHDKIIQIKTGWDDAFLCELEVHGENIY